MQATSLARSVPQAAAPTVRVERIRRPSRTERRAHELLQQADIRIGGGRPWDVRLHDARFYQHLARRGITGLGEAYVEGYWDCDALDELFVRALGCGLPRHLAWHPHVVRTWLRDLATNAQTRAGASRNGRAHYNLGNDLFEAMLDRRMAYSCGYWRDAATLDEAQEAKLRLVCEKLGLGPGMRLLDIGCGWGSLVRFAAEEFQAASVGITVSDQQADLAKHRCAGLNVQVRLQDYRDVDERFDRIASIGMFEHVGQKNHRTFMEVAHRCLCGDGLMVLHTIAISESFPNRTRSEADWVERNIFPGMVIPSMKQIGKAVDGLFIIEDVENFGADYDPTLMAWHRNFERAWPGLQGRYGDRFYRMWRYYLLLCAAAFRTRAYQVWQVVLSKRGVPGGYRRPNAGHLRRGSEARLLTYNAFEQG